MLIVLIYPSFFFLFNSFFFLLKTVNSCHARTHTHTHTHVNTHSCHYINTLIKTVNSCHARTSTDRVHTPNFSRRIFVSSFCLILSFLFHLLSPGFVWVFQGLGAFATRKPAPIEYTRDVTAPNEGWLTQQECDEVSVLHM